MLTTGSKVAIGLAAPVGLYAVILGVLITPYFQRFALYAHKFNTLFLQDVHDGECFGFAKGQITPFNIRTADGETLYAWHVLPLDVYARNEKQIREEPHRLGPVDNFQSSLAFKLLSSSPDSKVVISFHGNAGHIAQGWRTDTFRYLISQPNTHVLTIDYRGFGHSTGSPTEAGLIADGVALLDWVLNVARIPPERIVLLGQSLGTAVASAVALNFADPVSSLLLPPSNNQKSEDTRSLLASDSGINPFAQRSPTTFAGIVLVVPFSSLPSLMLTYRLSGVVPLLLPLRPFPFISTPILSRMVDQWPTADRLAAYYRTLLAAPRLLTGTGGRRIGSLQIIHARSDMDISYHQTEIIADRVLGKQAASLNASNGAALLDVRQDGAPAVRIEIGEYGGHNRIVTYSPVALAILRAFDDL